MLGVFFMSEDYGFVYIWFDKSKKRFYIGCHWGNINDGYICSSSNMKKAYLRRPFDFKRKILSYIYTDKKDLLEEEYKWLSQVKTVELGKRYYNLHNHHFNHWSSNPQHDVKSGPKNGSHSEESKKLIRKKRFYQSLDQATKWRKYPPIVIVSRGYKISQAKKGKSNGLEGKILTEEHKRNLRKPKSIAKNKYKVTCPDGSIVYPERLGLFAEEKGLNRYSLYHLANGTQKVYKGYKVDKI